MTQRKIYHSKRIPLPRAHCTCGECVRLRAEMDDAYNQFMRLGATPGGGLGYGLAAQNAAAGNSFGGLLGGIGGGIFPQR